MAQPSSDGVRITDVWPTTTTSCAITRSTIGGETGIGAR